MATMDVAIAKAKAAAASSGKVLVVVQSKEPDGTYCYGFTGIEDVGPHATLVCLIASGMEPRYYEAFEPSA